MKTNKFGEQIYSEDDVLDILMRGFNIETLNGMIVDYSVDLNSMPDFLEHIPNLQQQTFHKCSVPEWHAQQQSNWLMPDEYKNLDIAEHLLSLCKTDAELQRVGHELMLYQDRNLFDLLRYLKYLVDLMRQNNIVWGVGRGSSVASFVLYKIGVHRINSIEYQLPLEEFFKELLVN